MFFGLVHSDPKLACAFGWLHWLLQSSIATTLILTQTSNDVLQMWYRHTKSRYKEYQTYPMILQQFSIRLNKKLASNNVNPLCHPCGKKIAGNDAVAAGKTIRQNVNLFWSFSTQLNPHPSLPFIPMNPPFRVFLPCLSFQRHIHSLVDGIMQKRGKTEFVTSFEEKRKKTVKTYYSTVTDIWKNVLLWSLKSCLVLITISVCFYVGKLVPSVFW